MVLGLKRRQYLVLLFLHSVSGVLLVTGWKLLWFLTDDAFICFRYVSNSMLGHGYVWNPPPFQPVEGYTSFLWVVLLDGVWRALGIAPPVAANYISLMFTFLTLLVISWMVMRMNWSRRNEPYRMVFLGIILLGITTNRTFLTWSSSGLETAMFNFFLLLWVSACIHVRPDGRWFGLLVTSSATGIYLTRPDGALFVLATAAILILAMRRGILRLSLGHLAGLLPLVAVPVHLMWRLVTYGEWLPNSYYAKFTSPWPESGIRFAASFILEYGIWLWMALLAVVVGRLAWSRLRTIREASAISGKGDTRMPGDHVNRLMCKSRVIVIAALAVHGLYYTLIIGGDHFEYRVYSHLIPLGFVSFVWMLNRAGLRRVLSFGLLLAFVFVSLPVGWTHWGLTRNLNTREQTHKLFVEVADHWPGAFRWYARLFDTQQAWLTAHYVCTRHQEHKMNCEFLQAVFPSRDDGLLLPDTDYPVFAFGAVGVVSWVMPRINIIDTHGINDYVIARCPVEPGTFRMMGHDRMAPPGYVECFRPNVEIMQGRRMVVGPRQKPLTAQDITKCERRWAEAMKGE